MPEKIVTSSAHEPQTTAVRSRVGVVSAGIDAISEAKTAVAAAAPQTTIDGDGTAGTPHPRQNSHAQRAGTTEDGELPISVVGPRWGEIDAGIRRT